MLKAWEQPTPISHCSSISASYLPTSGRVFLKWMQEPHSDANGGKSNMTAFAFCIQFSCCFLKGKNTKAKRVKKDTLNNFAAQVFYIGSGVGPGPAPTTPKRAEFCAYSWVGGGLYMMPYETDWRTCMQKAAVFCSSQCYQHSIPAAEGNPLREGPRYPYPI